MMSRLKRKSENFQRVMKRCKRKGLKRLGTAAMATTIAIASVFGTSQVTHAQDVGGITVTFNVNLKKAKEQGTATMAITNGPSRDLQVQAWVYYRWGTKAYYTTSGEKTVTATSHTQTATARHSGGIIDYAKGKGKVSYNSVTWTPSDNEGELVSGKTYVLDE